MGRDEEIEDLKLRLRQREGMAGYKYNCEKLRQRIAELEAMNGG